MACAIVFVAGCAFSVSLLLKNLKTLQFLVTRNVIPGSFEMIIPHPGHYQIWYEYSGVFENKTYATGKKIPSGLACEVRHKARGNKIMLIPAGSSATYSIGSRHAINLWGIDIEEPGLYEFTGDYEPGWEGPQLILTVTPGLWELAGQAFNRIAFPLFLIACVFLLAILLIIAAFLRYLRRKTSACEGTSPLTSAPLAQEPLPYHRTAAAFCHLGALAFWLGVPFGNIIVPLIIWLLTKNESPFVDAQGKESLNFQISMTIYFFSALFLVLLLIGIPLLIFLSLAEFILVIIAAVQASDGKSYRYPFTMRFIR